MINIKVVVQEREVHKGERRTSRKIKKVNIVGATVARSASLPPCIFAERALTLLGSSLHTHIAVGLRKDGLSLSVHGISLVTVTVPKGDTWPTLHDFISWLRGEIPPSLWLGTRKHVALLTAGSDLMMMRGLNYRMKLILWTVEQEPRLPGMFSHAINCSRSPLSVRWERFLII